MNRVLSDNAKKRRQGDNSWLKNNEQPIELKHFRRQPLRLFRGSKAMAFKFLLAAGGVDVKNVAHMFLLVHACSCSNSTVVRGSRSSGHGGSPTRYHRLSSANLCLSQI